MKTPDVGLILNRVSSTEKLKYAAAVSKLPLLGWLPEDETIKNYDLSGRSILELADCPSLRSADVIAGRVMKSED